MSWSCESSRKDNRHVSSSASPPPPLQGFEAKTWTCGGSHLHGDPPVDPAPQTDARGRLNLVWGRPGRLVALAVGAHLQVLMNDVCKQKPNEFIPGSSRVWRCESLWLDLNVNCFYQESASTHVWILRPLFLSFPQKASNTQIYSAKLQKTQRRAEDAGRR